MKTNLRLRWQRPFISKYPFMVNRSFLQIGIRSHHRVHFVQDLLPILSEPSVNRKSSVKCQCVFRRLLVSEECQHEFSNRKWNWLNTNQPVKWINLPWPDIRVILIDFESQLWRNCWIFKFPNEVRKYFTSRSFSCHFGSGQFDQQLHLWVKAFCVSPTPWYIA